MITKNDYNSFSDTERIYALDALRAVMMLLGIIIHVSITYGTTSYGAWPLKDHHNNHIFDEIVSIIHIFRMPIFFTTSGFLGALLFYKKGPKVMIIKRAKRLVLPFILALLIVHPIVIFSIEYSKVSFAGAASPFKSAFGKMTLEKFIPFDLDHLWFLYLLIIFTALAWVLALILKSYSAYNSSIVKLFSSIFRNTWLRISSMILFLCFAFFFLHSIYFTSNTKWFIEPRGFSIYFVFFCTGWMLFKTNTLYALGKYPFWQLGFALVIFLFNYQYIWPAATWVPYAKIFIAAIYTTLFFFGFFGFFIKYFNHYSPVLNYTLNASYWVYIIHLPLVALIPGLLADYNLPSWIKFSISLISSNIICFISYKYLVKNKFLELFLNGKIGVSNKMQYTDVESLNQQPV